MSEPPDHAQVAFHPPLLLGLAILAGFLLRRVFPLMFVPASIGAWSGPAVIAAALVLAGWAMRTMRVGDASIPTREPTNNIVASGPFRFSRNPIYLSMLLLLIGCALWANSLWFVIFAGLSMLLLTSGVIVREERYLERKFGMSYSDYKSRVRRWI